MDSQTTSRRLYRSRQQRMVAGVAGGLGQHFSIDPTLVRLGFVITGLIPGVGGVSLLLYIVLAIVVPVRPAGEVEPAVLSSGLDSRRAREIVGVALVVIGLLALSGAMGLYRVFDVINWGLFWPLALIGIGALLLLRQRD